MVEPPSWKALSKKSKYHFKDGWVEIMYNGIDAFGVDKQPVRNHNPWMLLYFISFLLIVAFFVLNMFVGVVVENFHRCRQEHEAEMQRKKMVGLEFSKMIICFLKIMTFSETLF